MDDPVADILTQRASMESGVAAAVVLSLIAHGALSALAIWAAWHHTAPQTPAVMMIKFAHPMEDSRPRLSPAAAQPAVVQQPAKKIEVPVAKPVAKPVAASPYGKSLKKATPPAPVVAPVATSTQTSTQPQIAVGGTGVAGLEGGDFPYTLYIDRMKNLIGSRWLRPQVAAGAEATVYFVIERDGTIRDVKLETPSASTAFNLGAQRAVLESSPLPPLPFGYSGTYLGVHLNFR
jgi:outer membrane biosynthesis protein TonB